MTACRPLHALRLSAARTLTAPCLLLNGMYAEPRGCACCPPPGATATGQAETPRSCTGTCMLLCRHLHQHQNSTCCPLTLSINACSFCFTSNTVSVGSTTRNIVVFFRLTRMYMLCTPSPAGRSGVWVGARGGRSAAGWHAWPTMLLTSVMRGSITDGCSRCCCQLLPGKQASQLGK